MILNTYSSLEVDRASRWQDTGIRDEFSRISMRKSTPFLSIEGRLQRRA